MGSTTVSTGQGGTTTPQVTPQQQAMQGLQLSQYQQTAGPQTQLQLGGYSMANNLVNQFNQPGSANWNSLTQGINQNQQNSIVQQSLNSLYPGLQQGGIMNSGTAASVAGQQAANMYGSLAQFNVGSMQNALNMAMGYGGQVQSPTLGVTGQLGQEMGGEMATSYTGTGYQTNPFTGASLGILGNWGGTYCWVAAEIFGGWNKPKTNAVRYYIGNIAPTWFRRFYFENGERIAKFIHNKPIFKTLLRPLFEYFAYVGLKEVSNGIWI